MVTPCWYLIPEVQGKHCHIRLSSFTEGIQVPFVFNCKPEIFILEIAVFHTARHTSYLPLLSSISHFQKELRKLHNLQSSYFNNAELKWHIFMDYQMSQNTGVSGQPASFLLIINLLFLIIHLCPEDATRTGVSSACVSSCSISASSSCLNVLNNQDNKQIRNHVCPIYLEATHRQESPTIPLCLFREGGTAPSL